MLRPLSPPRLTWDREQPRASDYGDVYFSNEDPCGEVQTVFIAANDLPRRFRAGQRFSIGETGFGTGLNFFLTLDEWRRHAPPDSFLSYMSVEAHPLDFNDLSRALRAQEIRESDIAQLRSGYPPPLTGVHRIHFPADRVALTLVYGDAAPELAHIEGTIDAWFLDGFSPVCNPGLWNLAVFNQLARLSRSGTTFGTYTAAAQVRRDLTEVGFDVRKAPGFRNKRERLYGCFRKGPGRFRQPAPEPTRVAVVGAGIAGISAAIALKERGLAVTVFDPHGPAGRASGNPAALLTPHLSASDPNRNALALAGMRSACALFDAHRVGDLADGIVLARGVEHHGMTAHAERRLQRLAAIDPAFTGNQYFVKSTSPRTVLVYPNALGLDLARCCHHLSAALEIRREKVTMIANDPCNPALYIAGGRHSFDVIIIATGASQRALALHQPIPSRVAGQMTRIRAFLPGMGNLAVTGGGYCLPEREGQHWLGGTYRRANKRVGILDSDNRENLLKLSWLDPSLEDVDGIPVTAAWSGIRAVFPDRFPMVGALTAIEASGDSGHTHDCEGDRRQNVFLNLGYGSRGLLYAPLAAQILADRICGLPEPLPDVLSQLFSPQRFEAFSSSRFQSPEKTP